MGIIAWIVLGLIAGFIASKIYVGTGQCLLLDIVLGIVGAVVKDPIADQVAWSEYLEVVARERAGWSEFYTACRDVS